MRHQKTLFNESRTQKKTVSMVINQYDEFEIIIFHYHQSPITKNWLQLSSSKPRLYYNEKKAFKSFNSSVKYLETKNWQLDESLTVKNSEWSVEKW